MMMISQGCLALRRAIARVEKNLPIEPNPPMPKRDPGDPSAGFNTLSA
jgi:hypothetical protein